MGALTLAGHCLITGATAYEALLVDESQSAHKVPRRA